jgi:hypothetical protein
MDPLTTISYAKGLDYQYYWDHDKDITEAGKEQWIKSKFHWQDGDLPYWQAWAPKLWGGFERGKGGSWETLINTLLKDENGNLRSVDEISKFIKSHLNDKTTNGLYDQERSEGIVDENDDDEGSINNNPLASQFSDLTKRHFQ